MSYVLWSLGGIALWWVIGFVVLMTITYYMERDKGYVDKFELTVADLLDGLWWLIFVWPVIAIPLLVDHWLPTDWWNRVTAFKIINIRYRR